MSQLTLSLVIHNHQPVGNFDHIFAKATDKAYQPMLEALERHPGVRLGLHYSGPLLDWLHASRPEHLDLLGDLVAREQIELLTGGYYEPILVSIPEEDKLGQIRKMTEHLRERFGYAPRGGWVAEREGHVDWHLRSTDEVAVGPSSDRYRFAANELLNACLDMTVLHYQATTDVRDLAA